MASALLASCGGSSNETSSTPSSADSSSEESSSSSSSRRETLYDQLNRAFDNLEGNFTMTGLISSATSDGTNTEQYYYDPIIEVSEDAYYYLEADQATGEHLQEENAFATEDGYFATRTLNYVNNLVEETTYNALYSTIMANPLKDLAVKDISGIRSQPNWYLVDDNKTASAILYFLTGYATTSLEGYEPSYSYSTIDYTPTMVEFALHFDGDNFDQFRILIEFEMSEDDGTYYYRGMLFELDISSIGTTTPREIEPLEHTENHDKLQLALSPYAPNRCKNFTIKVEASYDTDELAKETTNYLIDYEKQILYSDLVNNGTIYAQSETEEDIPYTYHSAYQYEDGELYIYRYNTETNEFVRKDTFADYWGATGDTENISFYSVAPVVNALAPECYKDEGNGSFSAYSVVFDMAVRALLTFEEATFSSIDDSFRVNLDEEGNFESLTYSYTGTFPLDENYTTTVSATKSYTVSYVDLNTTVIPSYCVPHA